MSQSSTRRDFLRDAGVLSATAAVAAGAEAASGAAPPGGAEFGSRWGEARDRVWIGPEYWANPLQDWRLAGGRIECIRAAADRNVHLLTRALGPQRGNLALSVRIGRVGGGAFSSGRGSAGFRVGIQGPLDDYRSGLIGGQGLNAGISAEGGLFIGDPRAAVRGTAAVAGESVELRLTLEPDGDHFRARLAAHEPATGKLLGEVSRGDLAAERLVGGLALVANFGSAGPAGAEARTKAQAKAKAQARAAGPAFGAGPFWFADWRVSGSKLEQHDDRDFGPILFTQYSLSRGVLRLTAQLAPIGSDDARTVRLQVRPGENSAWKTLADEPIDADARTATFRIAPWDDTRDVRYRVVYNLASADGKPREYEWTGTVRRDPIDRPVLTVADVSCNTHAAFPNAAYVAAMARLDPDVLAFVGDQFYESSGGYGTTRKPVDAAILDYLRKWYLHGWTWRELLRDRPSLSIPDDHDVYQGNIWGEAGAPQHGTQEMGGFEMPAAWVNVVVRTQTSHNPDPFDPTPIGQGIVPYYGAWTYGRVSFAIVADRLFKSAPEGKVPPTGTRGDHVVNANFDPRTADLPGLELLGERQMAFLRQWGTDWRGAEMKALVSQTVFTAMATTHGANRERLRADYDANGWPQTARNAALRELRKAFAVHIAGDQHLPAVVHYGVDQHRDGGFAFAGPAVNVGYPRWWEPEKPGAHRAKGAAEFTGDFLDHFGNPMTVLAYANGAAKPRPGLLQALEDRASGLGLVRFNKAERTVTFECWPFLADVSEAGTQFPGWPVTVRVLEGDARAAEPAALLPRLEVRGVSDPVVQVVEEPSGEVVYTLRITGRSFQPFVFAPGSYTVRVSEPETGRHKELKGLAAARGNEHTIEVTL